MLAVAGPGILTTVQDLGRPRHRSAGVPPGGALDRFALAAANLLVGNEEGAPALECTLTGPALVAEAAVVVALAGGEFETRVNGVPAPGWTSLALAPGDRLEVGHRRAGARCYVAVAGGVAADRWLGSAATYALVGRGGLGGRRLQAGDRLQVERPPAARAPAGRTLPAELRPPYEGELGLVRGPHFARLAPESRRRLFQQEFAVGTDSDRMAYRLTGEPLALRGAELISFGVAVGCLQVPPSGRPILLMADHQTAGGYPVVGGAGRAWLPAAAQLAPGDALRFREVTPAAAQAEWARLRRNLETLRRPL